MPRYISPEVNKLRQEYLRRLDAGEFPHHKAAQERRTLTKLKQDPAAWRKYQEEQLRLKRLRKELEAKRADDEFTRRPRPRRRGKYSKRTTVWLSPHQAHVVSVLGDGCVSDGIRFALAYLEGNLTTDEHRRPYDPHDRRPMCPPLKELRGIKTRLVSVALDEPTYRFALRQGRASSICDGIRRAIAEAERRMALELHDEE